MHPYSPAEVERFWSKVDRREPDECWPWVGTSRGPADYGTLRVGSSSTGTRRNAYAHRMVCEMRLDRPLREGEQALHHCDNKRCVNPAHLYVGSHQDNMRDAVERCRTGGRPMLGEENGRAKLSAADVAAIRSSTEPKKVLAERYGLALGYVYRVHNGQSWRGLGDGA